MQYNAAVCSTWRSYNANHKALYRRLRTCLLFLKESANDGHYVFLLILSFLSSTCNGGVFNSDARYSLWPTPARIPYQIQINNINAPDFATLTAAMNQISADTAGCIKFSPYDATLDRNADFILFRNRLTAGIIDICYTFPGLVANNGFGQVAVVFGSSSYPGSTSTSSATAMPGACLDSTRDTMRLLMNLLGVRSEHNRNDRNKYLTFQSANPNSLVVSPLDKYNLFASYNSSVTIASTFDYQSITLVSGEKFAASLNTPVFVPVGGNSVGGLARLSRTDCLVINMLYRCSAPCPDPYVTSGSVKFNLPLTFAKHLYCPPLITSSVLTTPIVVGDVTIANAPGVVFQYTLTPTVSYLIVQSTTINVFTNPTTPTARILLTQIPNKGFVNGQFTLTATAGALTGSTTVTLTINCVPQFVSSSGGRPTFVQPALIGQPSTLTSPTEAFSVVWGDNIRPATFINCDSNAVIQPSTLGFVTATDPEGGRISYHVVAPFPNTDFNKGFEMTSDGVIVLIDNKSGSLTGLPKPFDHEPYASPTVPNDSIYIAAVDPAGGMTVIRYQVFYQCGPAV